MCLMQNHAAKQRPCPVPLRSSGFSCLSPKFNLAAIEQPALATHADSTVNKKIVAVSQLVTSTSDEDFHYGFNCVLQQRKVISVAFAWLQEHLLRVGVSWEAGCCPCI